ncbi:MAG: sugar phosphate isomerase/epimerase family protein [Bacteroidota bacterium]
MKYNRGEFLKVIGLTGAAALAGIPTLSASATSTSTPKPADTLRLGLASYTLRTLNLDQVIKVATKLDLKSIALKSMHLPLESSPDDIKAAAAKVRAAGLTLYGAGVIYMKTAKEVEAAFAYAANAGLEMIVGVPNHDLLSLANEQVKKYNIKLAIHNHGPGDDLYSSPSDVFTKIKDLDKRIGLCIDIGHVKRIGQDPVAMIEKYSDRLYDMHMKDVNKDTGDGTPLEVGRGIIDIVGVIKALKKVKYTGAVAFEYEKDGDDPVPGLAESVGYVRGVMKMVG